MVSKSENLFAKAAEQANIEQDTKLSKLKSKPMPPVNDDIVAFNLRLPRSMRKKCQQHRIDTGENMNQLILRLLDQELNNS